MSWRVILEAGRRPLGRSCVLRKIHTEGLYMLSRRIEESLYIGYLTALYILTTDVIDVDV